MNRSPDDERRIRERILATHRTRLSVRLQDYGDRLHAAIRLVDRLHREYLGLRRELEQREETTIRLPILPETGTALTDRLERG